MIWTLKDEFTGKTLKKQELELLLSFYAKENKGDKFKSQSVTPPDLKNLNQADRRLLNTREFNRLITKSAFDIG